MFSEISVRSQVVVKFLFLPGIRSPWCIVRFFSVSA
jgi:hypothetical protein